MPPLSPSYFQQLWEMMSGPGRQAYLSRPKVQFEQVWNQPKYIMRRGETGSSPAHQPAPAGEIPTIEEAAVLPITELSELEAAKQHLRDFINQNRQRMEKFFPYERTMRNVDDLESLEEVQVYKKELDFVRAAAKREEQTAIAERLTTQRGDYGLSNVLKNIKPLISGGFPLRETMAKAELGQIPTEPGYRRPMPQLLEDYLPREIPGRKTPKEDIFQYMPSRQSELVPSNPLFGQMLGRDVMNPMNPFSLSEYPNIPDAIDPRDFRKLLSSFFWGRRPFYSTLSDQ